ncbi:VOC family protein [Amycolatopsis rhabdoformis]|uniref:VOC family protein n=1 Tax=Amycolatopsis rhabdoformis TaxID=1448059 RepID=A0ABZ1I362_9PSEU|nr:VOC family protein [Amycolatopsis rhabdoformis]WSE28685.1 VOC family protein [Amycolatopsis rhabdoformis]
MTAKFKDLALDAGDHQALADWWCTALGYVRRDTVENETRHAEWPVPIVDAAGEGPLIWVNPVPEAKTLKNRMHLDVFGDAGELISLGATLVRNKGGDIDWWVLADPEGNEFCVFEPHE